MASHTYSFNLLFGHLRKRLLIIPSLKMEKVSQKEVKVIYSSWLLVSQDLYSGNLVPDFFSLPSSFFFGSPCTQAFPELCLGGTVMPGS